jgi:hypothetical protein
MSFAPPAPAESYLRPDRNAMAATAPNSRPTAAFLCSDDARIRKAGARGPRMQDNCVFLRAADAAMFRVARETARIAGCGKVTRVIQPWMLVEIDIDRNIMQY